MARLSPPGGGEFLRGAQGRHRNYLARSEGQAPLTELEEAGLLDVEVAITFLQDKRSGFGMGKGFFGMNLIQ